MPMLILKYSSYLLSLAVISLCISCTSGTPRVPVKSAADSLTSKLGHIGWEPYAQSLIINGELENYELLDSCIEEDDAFYKDSLYLAMQESDWAFFGIDWFYSHKGFTFDSYPMNYKVTGFNFKSHLFDSTTDSYQLSIDEIAQLKGILDSIKYIKPDPHYTEEVLVCSRLALVYYDGQKFYYLENSYGQPVSAFLDYLGKIFMQYYNKDKSKKKRKA